MEQEGMRMRIGIIGAGSTGGILARHLAKRGHVYLGPISKGLSVSITI